MQKRVKIVFKGKSNTEYEFEVYPINSVFEDATAALFFVTKHSLKNNKHKKIFIGETDDLGRYFNPLCKFSFGEHFGANCICCLYEPDPVVRKAIVQDLRDGNNTLYKDYQKTEEERIKYVVNDTDIIWEVSNPDKRDKYLHEIHS